MKFMYNKEVPNQKYKNSLLYKVFSTYQIRTKKKEYVWIIYKSRMTGKIKKLYLYNITDNKEESNKLLIEDMLKMLYAYMIILDRNFLKLLSKCLGGCQEHIRAIEGQITKQKEYLELLKMEMPSFAYNELYELVQTYEGIKEKEKEMIEFLIKYNDIAKQLPMLVKEIPTKMLLSFYQDFYLYYRAAKEVEEKIDKVQKQNDEYLSVMLNKDIFYALYKIMDSQKEKYELFCFYNKIPLVVEMIKKDFSEHIIDNYKPAIQNRIVESLS